MQVNVSSMNAHNSWMNANANNVANVNSKDYNSTKTMVAQTPAKSVEAVNTKSSSPTNLTKELTNQIPIEKGMGAQEKAIKVQEQMMGGILNILA